MVLIEGDAPEGIPALKTDNGPELQVHGSGNLLRTLLRHHVVDQYRPAPVSLSASSSLIPNPIHRPSTPSITSSLLW